MINTFLISAFFSFLSPSFITDVPSYDESEITLQDQEPEYVFTAEEISEQWADNKPGTRRMYLDKIVEVHGVFVKAEPMMFSDDYAIYLKGYVQTASVYIFDLKKEDVVNLKEGDELKIVGVFTEGTGVVEIGESKILR